jgi:hypothetical protein
LPRTIEVASGEQRNADDFTTAARGLENGSGQVWLTTREVRRVGKQQKAQCFVGLFAVSASEAKRPPHATDGGWGSSSGNRKPEFAQTYNGKEVR